MKKFTRFWLLLIFATFFASTLHAQYMVSGADEPNVDGYYYEEGTEEGKPFYTNGYFYLHYKSCDTKWCITEQIGDCPEYTTQVDGDIPPMEGWHEGTYNGFGKAPLIAKLNSIAIDKKIVIEAEDDDGSFTDSIQILLYTVENPFTGANGDNFVADGKVVVTNIPDGLTAVVERTGESSLVLKFTGSATNHTYKHNVNNISLQFQNSAFTDNSASEIENSLIEHIGIRYMEKLLVFDATETPAVNDTFALCGLARSKPMFTNGTYFIYYKGCAWGGTQWAIADNIGSCVTYSTKIDGEEPTVSGWSDNRADDNDTIYIAHLNSIHYYKISTFESNADDGTFTDSIIVRFVAPADGNTFTGTNDDDFVADGKLLVTNLPEGLTAVATRISETSLVVKFTGSATNHTPEYSINNATFEFQNSAFSGGDATAIDNYLCSSINMEFIEKFAVIDADDTDVNGIYISSGYLKDKKTYTKDNYTIGYKGCNAKWVLVDGTEIFTCPEYSTLYDGDTPEGIWGEDGRGGSQNDKVYVIKTNSILYNNEAFFEDSISDGSTSDSLFVRFIYPDNGDGFTGTNGDNFVSSGKVVISSLPDGLTAIATRTSDTSIVVKLTGNASHHTINYNVDNISIDFQNAAFTNGDASKVNYSTKNNIKMNFVQKYEVMFAESNPERNGTYISGGMVNDHIVYAKGEYRLGYRGCRWGSMWVIVDGDEDGNVSPGYCPIYRYEDFSDEVPMTGWDTSDPLFVYPHNSLLYNSTTFSESLVGDGSIDNSYPLVIRYFFPENGATFSGNNDDDFVAEGKVAVSNLPAGLTAIVKRTSDTTLAVVLNGLARSEDVKDLTFVFSNDAFTGMDASDVIFSTTDDLQINFHKEYYVASTGGDFTTITEAVADSKVSDGDVLILAAETFTEYGIEVEKALTFRGQGAGKTIVQANAAPETASNRIFYLYFDNDNYKDVSFENMTMQNGNIGDNGACIYSRYCNLSIKNCEIANNRSTNYYGRGGAIHHSYGTFSAENSTFSNNINALTYNNSYYGGGAIYLYSDNNSDTAIISNCTFSGNSATTYGGALLSYYNLKIVNSTFANNTANYGGGISRYSRTIDMRNVLVANNTATTSGNDIYGSVNANYCLIENVTGATITGANNVTGSDPELVPLAKNGGSTQTCAISATSPALDAGTNINVPLLDQRGVGIYNDTKDIGAYEFNIDPVILVSNTELVFGNVPVNDSKELSYNLSAINLTNNVVITAPAGIKISGYSGSEFVGLTSMTIVPDGGIIGDTTIYVQFAPTATGTIDELITHVSTDAETVNISVRAKAITKPSGDDGSVMKPENVEKYFTSDDFIFTDEDGGEFAGIQIVTKETNGDLEYNGSNVSDGSVCDIISKLAFKSFENESGLAYATFTFKVKDNTGLFSEEVYTMTIDVNDPPVVANVIPDGNAQVGVIYSYKVPENTFTDVNDGDVQTYTATLSDNSSLPAWLSFSGATQTFSGTPDVSGLITIKVTATDRGLENASDEFVLTIAPATTGLEDVFGKEFQVYPNPTNGIITISTKDKGRNVDMVITNIIGDVIIIKTIVEDKTEIDLSRYAKGIYFIGLSDGESKITKKVIVQ